MSSTEFLQDRRFLNQLDHLHIKQQFVKITVLNWKEKPLEQIQGTVISGSVNMDGSSSMRRTATLSIFAEEKENNLANVDHLFSVNKKCILELGIVNTVPNYYTHITDSEGDIISTVTIDYKERYGNIVWFPLGVYVMFNPSIAHGMTGVTISMNLKDKMCLLNGDLAGQIHSAVDFSIQDELVDINSQSIEKNPVLIYNIIKELVNHWGNESLNKIIISEVPLQIKQAVKWTGSDPLWVIEDTGSGCEVYTDETKAREEAIKRYYKYVLTTDQQPIKGKTYYILNENKEYIIVENPIKQDISNYFEKQRDDINIASHLQSYNKGDDVGYIYTDFVYPGELSCNPGETITSVLDKIIQIMGNFEYFYDVYGNFVFRQKQNYLNMTNTAYWAKERNNKNNNVKVGDLPVQVYEADNYRLSQSVYNFIDNTFTVSFNNTLNYNNIKNDFVVWGSRPTSNSNYRVPCRFHLAIDRKPSLHEHNIILFEDDYQVIRAVAWKQGDDEALKNPRTSKDWREQLYYQMLQSEKLGTDENTEMNNSYFQYYAELKEEFPKIFDLENQVYKTNLEQHPEAINYYLDFIDENSELGQYSVDNIGRRSQIINDNNGEMNCVFEPFIPDIVYIDASLYNNQDYSNLTSKLTQYGQMWTQIPPNIYSLLTIGGELNSCFEKIKDLLYQYTHVNNTISITALPIYYLEPNSRITVEDSASGIYDDYIVQSISLPLDISSTMSINCYKALQKI